MRIGARPVPLRSNVELQGYREPHRSLRRACGRRRFRRRWRLARRRNFIGGAGAVSGRDGIENMLRGSLIVHDDGTPRTKHVTTNVAIEVDEEAGTAVSRSYFTALQALPNLPLQPIVSGRYHDRFERSNGQWRFIERRVRTDLVGDVSRHLRHAAADR
jgi:SnoaL-like domain